jgi:hypothetical protein
MLTLTKSSSEYASTFSLVALLSDVQARPPKVLESDALILGNRSNSSLTLKVS